ncbi:MAG: peptidase [Nocardioides sp.]|nr:peptidase [Nocardioides sp.]
MATTRPQPDPALRTRLALALGVAVGLVATALALPGTATQTLTLREANEIAKAEAGLPHVDPPGTGEHTHDSRFKNALARSGETGATTKPVSARQAAAAARYVERERNRPQPELTTTAVRERRTTHPATRYALAGGCYALGTTDGRYVVATGPGRGGNGTFVVRTARRAAAARFRFQATDLGQYLLYTYGRRFLADTGSAPGLDDRPSDDAVWTVRGTPRRTGAAPRYTLELGGGRALRVSGDRIALGARGTAFVPERLGSCARYPEAGVDVSGAPHAGVTSYQEVRGYVDGHTHGMAFEFLGGQVHCGRPWHEYGVQYALQDCVDHRATGGNGAVLEAFLSGEPTHDPVGWPTFKDWPAPESLTHEGTYWKWLERSWRGGQRLFVNLFVENNQLCQLYPLKRNSCDDMDSVRLQARDIKKLQRYIDAQYGGPGKGFFRIVRSPYEARRVINSGKMAVVLGIETSVPFGCTFKAVVGQDVPQCTAADVTRQVSQMHRLGVRQMELVNKFDNALAGVAGDAGSTGTLVNTANFLETGTFWDMEHCEPADGKSADNPQYAAPDGSIPAQDAIFGAIGEVFGGPLPATPLYPPPAHCNSRSLTDLGAHTIRELAKRHMVFDPDHLSVRARQASMRVIRQLGYPGVISSHSWSTPDTYPQIYKAGGFITPYAGDSTGFVDKWRQHVEWADRRFYYGIGFGADINGLGAQGDPRGADVANPVTYPVTGLNGVRIGKQRAGKRVWDINVDGVAQYGLYPDWIEDLTQVAGSDGDDIRADMERGAEAYLQMWERAEGIAPDSCRNPDLRRGVGAVKRMVRDGMTTTQVMQRVGQPFRRLGREFGFCARTPERKKVMVTVRFSQRGRVVDVRA